MADDDAAQRLQEQVQSVHPPRIWFILNRSKEIGMKAIVFFL